MQPKPTQSDESSTLDNFQKMMAEFDNILKIALEALAEDATPQDRKEVRDMLAAYLSK